MTATKEVKKKSDQRQQFNMKVIYNEKTETGSSEYK